MVFAVNNRTKIPALIASVLVALVIAVLLAGSPLHPVRLARAATTQSEDSGPTDVGTATIESASPGEGVVAESRGEGSALSTQAVPGNTVTSMVDMWAGESKSGSFAIGNGGVVRGPAGGTASIANGTVTNNASNERKGNYSPSNGSAFIARGANSLRFAGVTINSGKNTLVLNIWKDASIKADGLTLNGSANDGNDVPFLMVGEYPNGGAGTLDFSGASSIVGARGSIIGGSNNSTINVNDGTLTIEGSDIKVMDGIRIVVKSGAVLVIDGSSLKDAWIDNGGTVRITNSDLDNCVIKTRANSALDISGSKLHGSTRSSQETMIHTSGTGATVAISNSEICDNRNTMGAGNPGASIVKVEGGTLSLSGVNVHDNRCETRGGALHLKASKLEIDGDSTFERNSAQFLGGAIYMEDTEATIGGSTFRSNGYQNDQLTTHQGGAIRAEQSALTLAGTKFDSNRTRGDGSVGGAVYVTGNRTELHVRGAKFTGNEAGTRGGALVVGSNARADIRDLGGDPTAFSRNTVARGVDFAGGGMFVDCAYVKMWDTVIRGNTAPDAGGGLSTCSTGTAQVWSLDGAAVFDNDVTNASAALADPEIASYKDLYVVTKTHRDVDTGELVDGRDGFSADFTFELVERMFNGGLHRWSTKDLDTFGRGHHFRSLIAQSDPTDKSDGGAKVVFESNSASKSPDQSAIVSGGAIACNGLLEVGTDTELKIVKVWDDAHDVDGMRPTRDQFKNDIKILANGQEISDEVRAKLQIDVVDLKDHPFVFADNVIDPEGIDVPEDYGDKDAWIVIVSGLPTHAADGTAITYTVDEVPILGYAQTERHGSEATHFEFTNTHEPTGKEYPSVHLEATKSLVGRELAEGEFSFELRNADGGLIETKSCDANGVVAFDSLHFESAGTYDYLITEVAGNDESVAYDTCAYLVHVVVSEENGKLHATTSYTRNGEEVGEVAFANKAKTTRTYTPASASLELTKTLEGSVLEPGQFSFRLYGTTGEQLQTKSNDANGVVLFDQLTFDEPGTYAYQIREDEGNPAITYDEAYHVVTFHVHDTGDGELTVTKTIELDGQAVDSPAFHNTVEGAPSRKAVPVRIEAAKTLEGRMMDAGQFSFTLDDADGRPIQTKANDENGAVVFDPVSFDEEGTYAFRVHEVTGEDAKVTYDGRVHVVTVTVRAGADGTLAATTRVTVDGEEVDALAFDNHYENDRTYAPVSLSVEAHKTLAGRALAAGEFSFRLDGSDGRTVQTKANDENGRIAFDAIDVYKPGTYVYTITEVQGDEGGIAYDTRSFLATIHVRETTDGTLSAGPATYTLMGEKVEAATFENRYTQPSEGAARLRTASSKVAATTPKTGDTALPAGMAVLVGALVVTSGIIARRRETSER